MEEFTNARPVRGTPMAVLVDTAVDGGWCEVSPHQHTLWLMYQMRPSLRGTYNIAFTARIASQIDTDALAHALDVLIARHPMLRARFAVDHGVLRQRIEPQVRTPLSVVSVGIEEAGLQCHVHADSAQPFDETCAPLMRATLYRAASGTQVLLLVFDHLICDGWSFFQLIEELGEILGRGTRAEVVAVEDSEFLAHVEQQRTWLTERRAERQLEHWQARLAEHYAPLDLPSDRFESEARATRVITLDADLTAALQALSKTCRVSMFVTLLASYFILLHRSSGQAKLSVGTPLPARSQEYQNTVGLFRNPSVLRAELTPGMKISELIAHLRSTVWHALKNQDLPFSELVQRMGAAGTGAASLFQTMFVFQKPRHAVPVMPLVTRMDGAGSVSWGGLVLHPYGDWHSAGAAGLDLMLEVMEVEDRLAVALDYNAGRFEESTIEQYLASWRAVLRAMTLDVEQAIDRMPCMSDAERHDVLRRRNATAAEYPRDVCIHELFEAQVLRTPTAIALEHAGQQLTYRELNERANRVAHRLRALGVMPDTTVALCVQRSVEMVVGVLAVLKAGGAYVPLDPGYPRERLALMLRDSEPLVLLTDPTSHAVLSQPLDLPILDIHEEPHWANAPTGNLERVPGFGPQRLAYVIYTSGSSGTPKGVMVEHGGVVNFLCSMQRAPGIQARDRVLALTSLSFDIAALEIYLPLINGARVIVGNREDAADGQRIATLLEQHGVTLLQGTPSMWQLLLSSGWAGQLGLTALSGGEALTRQLSRQITARVQRLWNLYGPTETTIWSTAALVDAESLDDQPLERIGRPIDNTHIYVLDAHGEPVPSGVRGEIYIGGAGVARGYLKRPELTAERFVRDPFSSEPSARMYRTGDLGRWRAAGDIEYLGRNDHQVKLRGFRIELGEIEAQLLEHPQVQRAVALVREDQPGNARLVAYYVGESLEVAELRARLEVRLPAYMVPSAYVRLAELPLTPNGKLDRKSLPLPGDDAQGQRYEMPQGDIESALARIWQDLLQVARVGRHDSFFELGGHSLLALTLVARVRQALDVELPLQQVFATPRLLDLAEAAGKAVTSTLPPLLPVARAEGTPASHSQEQLWLLAQMEGGSAAYHIGGGLRLRGRLNRAALQQALQDIIARHEALRTTFVVREGRLEQRIAPVLDFQLRTLEGSAQSVAELAALEAAAAFDLEHGPLIRGQLLRVSAEEHVLLLTMHHIVCDGWSMGVLVRELSALYAANVRGEPASLPPLAVQFADYAAWQRQWLSGPVGEQQGDFWRRTLTGAPVLLELPSDRPRPSRQDFTGERIAVRLAPELVKGLRQLSARHGVTLYMTLLAGWAALLSRLSGQEEIMIGSPVANRRRVELESLIGMFVNTLALRIRVGSAPTVEALLAHVKSVSLDAQNHQDLPFEQVVELLQPPHTLAHSPVFQVMFVWQNTPALELQLPGLSATTLEARRQTSQFDLLLSLGESNDEVVGGLDYASSLFTTATIERYLGHWQSLLAGMVANEQARVDRLPLLSEPQRHQILREWNATQREYPQQLALMTADARMDVQWSAAQRREATDPCVHVLIEQQAARTPNHPAVVFANRTLTYRELDAEANRLAHYLLGKGVVPDTLVAVCMERSVEMVVSLLAILKAGAAYVPLEPDLPSERINYMLADSGARVVLTQQRHRDVVSDATREVLCVDSDWSSVAELSAQRAPGNAGVSNLAYVIYTSGSTGTPKGCMLTHAGLTNRLLWMQREYRLNSQDRVLQKTPYSFDVSVWEFFWPLLSGATLVVAVPQGHKDPQYLMQLIEAQRITTCHFVPSMLNAFLGDATRGRCASLRQVFASGEALPYDTCVRFAQQLDCKLHNLYGPTEASIDVSFWEYRARSDRRIPIGRPIDNMQLYVLDPRREPVPIGVAGELHIAGVGLARGYLNRPELTAEKFVDNPFGGPGARMYKTGDLARWLPDGNIEYLGRLDHQVKLRGFRIELGEIETQLQRHEQVRECAVALRDDSGGPQLVAYCVAAEGQTIVSAELREFLKQSLPEYMVPTAWVTLDALPLTSSGKLDRRALPALEQMRHADSQFIAARNPVEARLEKLWREVLGAERIGMRDSFFDHGGHSLKAVTLISRIADAFEGRRMSQLDFYRAPTIEAVAEWLGVESTGQHELLPLLVQIDAAPRMTLICSPYAGASATVFQPLAEQLARGDNPIAVYAVSIPGNEFGSSQGYVDSIEQLAADCVEEIMARVSGPIAVYGHCIGTSLAMEITHQLEERGRTVSAFIAGAAFPFSRWTRYLPFEDRWQFTSDASLQRMIANWGGPGESVDSAVMQHLLRNFRKDSRIAFKYQKQRSDWRMQAPVINIISRDDQLTRGFERRHHLWKTIADNVELRQLESGGHYFVGTQAAAIADIVRELANGHRDVVGLPLPKLGGVLAPAAGYQRTMVSSVSKTLPG